MSLISIVDDFRYLLCDACPAKVERSGGTAIKARDNDMKQSFNDDAKR